MEANTREDIDADDSLASFLLECRRLQVKLATNANRVGSLGEIKLAGVCYVIVNEPDDGRSGRELTRRERQIALQIARGYGTKQIAYELGISPHTAATYINRIRAKLGVRNRPEMVAALLRG